MLATIIRGGGYNLATSIGYNLKGVLATIWFHKTIFFAVLPSYVFQVAILTK